MVAAAVALVTALASWIQAMRRPSTIARAGGTRPPVSRSTPATSPTPRSGSASSSVATPRLPPASSSAGPRREDASHDDDPAGVLFPATRTGRDGGTGAREAPLRASRPRPRLGLRGLHDGETSPLRKAAIVLVSLEQSLASQLLSHLDRSAVEMVTWEIARLDRIDPAERTAVLDEFYGLGLRRLCFVFDDLVKMGDADIRAAFHEEDRETWALAMAGAAASVRAKVLGALSAASASALRQHLDHLGPFRLSDSEAAQLEVADRLRRLYDQRPDQPS